MTSILSLPAPPTDMLKEAVKEEADYMREMLRICLTIKEFRIHAKPIIGKKLTETPSGKIMRDHVEKDKVYINQLKEQDKWVALTYALTEHSPVLGKTKRKFMAKKLQSLNELTSYCSKNPIDNWKKDNVKTYLARYYAGEYQLKDMKIPLEKQVALSIAYLLCRKSNHWEKCYPSYVEDLLENKFIVNYCQKYSAMDILKKRKELKVIDKFNKSYWCY